MKTQIEGQRNNLDYTTQANAYLVWQDSGQAANNRVGYHHAHTHRSTSCLSHLCNKLFQVEFRSADIAVSSDNSRKVGFHRLV